MENSGDIGSSAKIRLYVDHPLAAGQQIVLSRAQAHYLFGVMRLSRAAQVLVFNGTDGEWQAEVSEAGKRGGVLSLRHQTAPQKNPPDLWLLFAPVKKARTDFIVEKAVELGAARLVPIQTDYTNSGRIQQARLQAHAVEAAEQCGANFVPQIAEMSRLSRLLDTWEPPRRIMFCDERLAGAEQAFEQPVGAPGPWAILIGPEGGFSPAERQRLHGFDLAHPVRLGPRILRAETAAIAALVLWQQALGDWQ